jgi:hypothetical protein
MKLAVVSALLLASTAPALADQEGPITHTDQLIVVTPNPPVVINNGAPGAPQTRDAEPPPYGGPSAPVAAPSAPQNEHWSNVSHINGTPVKVGEKGDYLYRFRKTNISSNPIGWMIGIYGLSVQHAVHENVALRVDGNLFSDAFGEGESGYELGATAQLYFRRAYSGPFLEAGIITRDLDDDYECYDSAYCSEDLASSGPQVMVGYSTIFDSGLNMSLAFGIMKNMNAQMDEYGYSGDETEPVGYFRVGYAL